MSLRTDLAIESTEGIDTDIQGIKSTERTSNSVKITKTEILSEKAEEALGREKGKYITLEFLTPDTPELFSVAKTEIIGALGELIPEGAKSILVIGLGNSEIVSDSIGPETAGRLLATRHIAGDFAESIGLNGLRTVSVFIPNVLGKTGIETGEIAEGITGKIHPDAVIAIDALASQSVRRLFKTVQLCNTGISPGSGVKNSRHALNEKSLGVPVIAIGVPTVVDALTLAYEITGEEAKEDIDMILTPKDADILCHRISEILSTALNIFLQPEIPEEILLELV